MQGEIDAILFDNDGVLVDTEPLFLQATQELLASVSIEIGVDQYRDISLRQGRSVLDLMADRGASPAEVEALRVRRNARYAELIERGVSVFPGVPDVLERLHGELSLAIVTSSYRHHFELTHRQTGFLRYFEFCLANGDYVQHKPHPEPYLTAAARLRVDPARCLVIEDSERGLQAAAAAGMRCIVVPTELTAASDFSAAERVIQNLVELPALLGL
jgi:HAD superfamily hydrolase (TIGR01509 family)